MFQRTIKKEVVTKNIGIHSGKPVTLTMRPAAANVGINFRRTDVNSDYIKVNPMDVKQTVLCTGLSKNGIDIKTIEHLMSALFMVGIDNIYIDLDSYEVPIMDGSSMPFIFLIKEAGIEEFSVKKKIIKIKKNIEFFDGDRFVKVKPSNTMKINYQIDFENQFIKNTNQILSIDVLSTNLVKDISKARTFGFLKDVEYLKENKLALGGSTENAIIVDDYRILNGDGLRYDDEFVRHKLLDMIGDLYVSGHIIYGEFSAYKSGHYMNNMLLREILSCQENYELVDIKDVDFGYNNKSFNLDYVFN